MKALFLIGAVIAAALPAHAQNNAAGQVLSSQSGRFVYGQVSTFRRDQFMLDTQTGRMWQLQCLETGNDPAGCKQLGLLPILYADLNGNPAGFTAPATGK